MPCLIISVRFHEGRYHGRPEWPPSPARLFQALVAGTAHAETLVEEDRLAFSWLESLEAPVIAAPAMRAGQSFRNYVPNNDLDAVGGDPVRVSEIRAPKPIRPILFEPEIPLIYVWTFDDSPEGQTNAHRICAIAEGLYQLGRGVDMAWARGEILTEDSAEARLVAQGTTIHRPGNGTGGSALAVPFEGSLASLIERYRKVRGRFRTLYESKPSKKEPDRKVVAGKIFVQPPKPRFRQVTYDSPSEVVLFDLVGEKARWRSDRIVELTERVRDAATQRLKEKAPDKADMIRKTIVGHRNSDEADKAARLRIIPLPSIGHAHADHAIRRVLMTTPSGAS
jgi:CRISPR-associated protein Csb2